VINLPEPFLWLDLVLQIIDPRQAHWLQSIDLTEYSFQRWCTQPSSKKLHVQHQQQVETIIYIIVNPAYIHIYLPRILLGLVLKVVDSGTVFYAF
jgi:hypothetical protein